MIYSKKLITLINDSDENISDEDRNLLGVYHQSSEDCFDFDDHDDNEDEDEVLEGAADDKDSDD